MYNKACLRVKGVVLKNLYSKNLIFYLNHLKICIFFSRKHKTDESPKPATESKRETSKSRTENSKSRKRKRSRSSRSITGKSSPADLTKASSVQEKMVGDTGRAVNVNIENRLAENDDTSDAATTIADHQLKDDTVDVAKHDFEPISDEDDETGPVVDGEYLEI